MDDFESIPATREHRSVFRNLMHLYLYDFSEYIDEDANDDGFFEDEHLDKYWVEPTRYPFLLKVGGKWAGFVLVREIDPAWLKKLGLEGQGGEKTYSIAEFFVMRKYRRRNVGKRLAFAMFDRFRGRWWVSQEVANIPAQQFWLRIIDEYTGGNFEDFIEPHEKRPTQLFRSA